MSVICPTITETQADPHEYKRQMENIQDFAQRIQIDLMDGEFAPSRSVSPIQTWWPERVTVDIHMMFLRPLEHIETLVSLQPNLVIIHAEAQGNLLGMMRHLKQCGIKAGVALLRETTVESAQDLVKEADHVLLFSGDLGYFGGTAHLEVLDKVYQVREVHPGVEIGWDGGANLDNVEQLVAGGIDVINVGSAIQQAPNPREAYDTLNAVIHKQ
jgi:ribulose-phosphate 3-epimerase